MARSKFFSQHLAGFFSSGLEITTSRQGEMSPFNKTAFLSALKNMYNEELLSKYLKKQSQLHPNEYRETIQEYVKEQLLNRTGLMRHVSFFDPDNTGNLSFFNGAKGFMDLGFDAFSSFGMTCLVIGGGVMGTQKLRPPVRDAHKLQHPLFHTAAFNQTNPLHDAHDRMVNNLVDQIMMGRNEIKKEDILAFANEIEKRHPVSGRSRVGQYLLKQLQILAFNNLKKVCGGKLTKNDLMELYAGTLFYAKAKPETVAHRVVALRQGDA